MDFLSQLQAFLLQLDQIIASEEASKAQADLVLAQYQKENPLAVSVRDQVKAAIDSLTAVTPLR